MPINQFAKISPMVNNKGYILPVNEYGIVTDTTPTENKLKNNEIGIVYNENKLITIYNGKLINLSSSIISQDKFDELVANNTNGELDGQLYCILRQSSINSIMYTGYDIAIIQGTSYYNMTEGIVYNIYWNITDSYPILNDGYEYNNSYISKMPYTITRLTCRLTDDLKYNDQILIGKIRISVEDLSGTSNTVYEVPLTGDIKSSKFDLFECVNLFSDYIGKLRVDIYNETGELVTASVTNKNIELLIEYIIK